MNFLLFADPIIDSPLGAMISANWIMLVLAAVVSFFLIRTLNKFQETMDKLVVTVNDIQVKLAVHDQQLKSMDDAYVKGAASKVADLIYAKIKTAQG